MKTITISKWTDWSNIVEAANNAGGDAEKHCVWLSIDNEKELGVIQFNDEKMDAAVFEQAFQNQNIQALKNNSMLKNIQGSRAAEYPPITDYIDGIVKGDQAQMQAYIDACLAIKAKYPKP